MYPWNVECIIKLFDFTFLVSDILNEPSRTALVDQSSLKQLTDMGFPENRATKALMLNKYVGYREYYTSTHWVQWVVT